MPTQGVKDNIIYTYIYRYILLGVIHQLTETTMRGFSRLGQTIVVGQDEAPLGCDTEHGPGLVKGELVGAPGAPRLARQLEGGHMMRIHPVI